MTKPDYADLVAQAERAVEAVKNPELKRVAFEKVLDDLLGGHHVGTQGSASGGQSRTKAAVPAAGPKSKKGGPQAYVEEMVAEGFFKKPKTIAEVKSELLNRGHHIPITSLSGPLQKLCQKKTLRRQKGKGKGNKQTFSYSEW